MEVTPEEVDECFSEVDANNDRVSSAHASVRDLVWILVLPGVPCAIALPSRAMVSSNERNLRDVSLQSQF